MPYRHGLHAYFILVQVLHVPDLALRISHPDRSRPTNMANRKTTEVVTRNEEYTTGFIAGVSGVWVTANPYVVNSFEWLSWTAGWTKGRFHYMDEGWVVS